MLNSKSVKTRFLVSVVSNFTRAAIGFFSGLLIARGLHPTGYGDFTFLLGSFVAISNLLDMGSSNAFYTFIARKNRSRNFFLLYFGWLALQFTITSVAVSLIIPDEMLAKVWVGHRREIILLAFAASFMQQQVWQTVNQIGESTRQTVRVQALAILMACVHLALISVFIYKELLSIRSLFLILIAEYLVAVLVAYLLLRKREGSGNQSVEETTAAQIFAEFWGYCKPLILLSWIGFMSEFADRWMLQRFGGAGQQGFYQISFQFAAVSLLATSSILKVFWKEIAEEHGRGNTEQVALLYRKVNRGLVMLGAISSGFLIPWTKEIVTVFLGQAYLSAVPVLMVMFLYPIHQSMGQIGGTTLLASGNTRAYMKISTVVTLASIPLSYLVQAPSDSLVLPGFGLGAVGMGLKMVSVGILSVNFQAYVIARICKWKYDWLYQVIGISAVIVIGFAAKIPVNMIFQMDHIYSKTGLIAPLIVNTAIYAVLVGMLIWFMPWLAGLERESIRQGILKIRKIRGGPWN